MLSSACACDEAGKYLARSPFPHKGYRWVVPEPKRSSNGWIFDNQFESETDVPVEKWLAFCGAPAFVVANDRSARDLGWDEI